jgi:hypothetical protein
VLDKNQMLTISRCQAIIACTMKGMIEPAELVHTLLTPDVRFRHIAEEGALGRIYRAYNNVSDNDWVIIYVVSQSLTC